MKKSGQALIEVICGFVIMVAIVIALIDLSIVVYGVSLNDSACRNAARAAAAGNPDEAQNRVQIAIEQLGIKGYGTMISRPELTSPVEVNLTNQPIVHHNSETNQLVNPGGVVTGTVTVRTQVEIKPIAVDFVFKRCKPLLFQSSQTFPIHYVVPTHTNALADKK